MGLLQSPPPRNPNADRAPGRAPAPGSCVDPIGASFCRDRSSRPLHDLWIPRSSKANGGGKDCAGVVSMQRFFDEERRNAKPVMGNDPLLNLVRLLRRRV